MTTHSRIRPVMQINVHDFKTNYFLPLPTRIMGGLVTLIGGIAIYTNGWIGLLIFIAGLGMIFTRYGVFMEEDQARFKSYLNIFGFKYGSWKSMKDYPFVTVLHATEKTIRRSLSNNTTSSTNKVYRVTLLSTNHREKILLRQLHDESTAQELAVAIAANLPLEKVVYSPY
ncbi:MAG: hypothetical protein WBA16_00840 [Nonlabens sp.]